MVVEININPVEGLKLWCFASTIRHRQDVEININPVEGLKRFNAVDAMLPQPVEININPVEGLKLTVAMSERRALIGSRNQHQPSRGIETTLVGDYWESERHVEININPVEGLKLT